MKKIFIYIMTCIIIIGIIIGVVKGLNVGLIYKENISFSVYVGEKLEDDQIKKIAKEIFPGQRTLVQKIELFEDMFSITTDKMEDGVIEEKKENLANKINEVYGTEISSEEIYVSKNPKIRISSVAQKYFFPLIIATTLIIIYQMIRYRKLGIFKVLGKTIGAALFVEAFYLALIEITRIPVNRVTIPLAIVLFIGTITSMNIFYERQLDNIKK